MGVKGNVQAEFPQVWQFSGLECEPVAAFASLQFVQVYVHVAYVMGFLFTNAANDAIRACCKNYIWIFFGTLCF